MLQPEQDGLQRIPVAQLTPGDSPRLSGEDEAHARTLAETEADLPPILVHGETLRVIDGAHRVRAAMLNGETHVEVRVFNGSVDEAFVEAVRSNVAHGKPLSRGEREAAVRRILASFPTWSDRCIADVCAVSSRTVASLRQRASENGVQLNVRIGRDGRVRPLDPSEGRRRAAEVLARNPDASLREIARQAQISPATARDVKARLRDGVDPITPRRSHLVSVPDLPEPAEPEVAASPDDPLKALRADESLLSIPSGQRCVDLFTERFVMPGDWKEIADELPLSRIYVVGDLARLCAKSWSEFADALQERSGRRRC